MNRDQFKQHAIAKYNHDPREENLWEKIIQHDEEPFWIPEARDGWKASHFAECWCSSQNLDEEFWEWCNEHMSKSPLCFMSDLTRKKEWWGFNTDRDMLLFLLRWT